MSYSIQLVSEDLSQQPLHFHNIEQPLFTSEENSFQTNKIGNSPFQSSYENLKHQKSNDHDGHRLDFVEDKNYNTAKFTKNVSISSETDSLESQSLLYPNKGNSGSKESETFSYDSTCQQRNFIGKTSFCIDALLSKASNRYREINNCKLTQKMDCFVNIKEDNINLNTIEPAREQKVSSILNCSFAQNEHSENVESNFLQQTPSVKFEHSNSYNEKKDLNKKFSQKIISYSQDSLKSVKINTNVNSNRTISASPDSNESRSLTNSPPISPGCEQTGMLIENNKSITGLYELELSNSKPNNLIIHQSNSLIDPGSIYYQSNGTSAFHTICKEERPAENSQHRVQHSSHHIHSIQLEWLARTGMLYPRLSADFAGNRQ